MSKWHVQLAAAQADACSGVSAMAAAAAVVPPTNKRAFTAAPAMPSPAPAAMAPAAAPAAAPAWSPMSRADDHMTPGPVRSLACVHQPRYSPFSPVVLPCAVAQPTAANSSFGPCMLHAVYNVGGEVRWGMSVQSAPVPGAAAARDGGRKQIDIVMEKLRG